MKKALLAILVLALGSLVTSAQSIVKESPLGAYGAMHWTLSNGINVYVKASKLQPGWLTIAGTSPGGYSHNYTPAQASSLKQLNTVMAVSGAGGMTAVELGKMLRADSARMRTYVERDEEGFAGSCKRTGLETALKVLQLKALHPQIDTAAVNKYVAVNKKANAKHDDPKFAFADSIFANVFGHHPVGSEKVSNYDLDHIDLDFILQVYQDRFADLSDMSVFVVGDFDPDSLKTLVVKYIATLPGKGRVEKPVDIGYRLFDSSKTLRFTAKMAEPQDKVYFFWTTQVEYTLKNYLTAQVAGRILSDMWLDDLRGKHGWTKHIDSHCSVVDTDGGPAIYFPFNATVTAGKGEAARQLVLGDLERVARGNVTAAQLKAQQDYYSRVHKENMGTNGYWMQMLQNYVLNDGLDFDGPYQSTLDSISRADVAAFVARLLNEGRQLNLMMTPAQD